MKIKITFDKETKLEFGTTSGRWKQKYSALLPFNEPLTKEEIEFLNTNEGKKWIKKSFNDCNTKGLKIRSIKQISSIEVVE